MRNGSPNRHIVSKNDLSDWKKKNCLTELQSLNHENICRYRALEENIIYSYMALNNENINSYMAF